MANDNNHHSEELTDAEAELYDRQIRLWGLDSQKRLRSANILLIGLNGFGAEVAKNVILSGVKSMTFLDHRDLTTDDFTSQFLAPRSEVGKNRAEASLQRAQKLNPMVEVKADKSELDSLPDSYFKKFNTICATQCTITQIKRLNDICRKNDIKFFVGDVWGLFGYTFADLGRHEFVEDVVQSKKIQGGSGDAPSKNEYENITTTVKSVQEFVTFEKVLNAQVLPKGSDAYYLFLILLNYREKYGKDPSPRLRNSKEFQDEAQNIINKYNLNDSINYLLQGDVYLQVSPACAIVGGVMSQEIIKAVSQKEAPHNNLYLFNPSTLCGKIIKLHNSPL